MYNSSQSPWYYPSSIDDAADATRYDDAGRYDEKMMVMMRQHIMTTNEIKPTVDIIDERIRRMKAKMREMDQKMKM